MNEAEHWQFQTKLENKQQRLGPRMLAIFLRSMCRINRKEFSGLGRMFSLNKDNQQYNIFRPPSAYCTISRFPNKRRVGIEMSKISPKSRKKSLWKTNTSHGETSDLANSPIFHTSRNMRWGCSPRPRVYIGFCSIDRGKMCFCAGSEIENGSIFMLLVEEMSQVSCAKGSYSN